jgi:hypothetical protein
MRIDANRGKCQVGGRDRGGKGAIGVRGEVVSKLRNIDIRCNLHSSTALKGKVVKRVEDSSSVILEARRFRAAIPKLHSGSAKMLLLLLSFASCNCGHLRGCLARSACIWRFDRPKALAPAREILRFRGSGACPGGPYWPCGSCAAGLRNPGEASINNPNFKPS